ncbi:MAG: translation initiation factor IF-6 [Methanosarcinales archaeon]|nr:translation initiation factor IF-6 [Methanosarcinales archaeon]
MVTHLVSIEHNSVIGVFATCTENVALIPNSVEESTAALLREELQVDTVPTEICNGSIIGSLVTGNSKGFVVSWHTFDSEIAKLAEYGNVARLPSNINAAGNVILANDRTALVHQSLSDKAVNVISDTMDVDVHKGTIGGLNTVGMAGFATNNGVLVHPKVTDAEIKMLERIFDLPIGVGSVNFGSPLVGSGILANSKGYVAGKDTTGIELGRIYDVLM